MSRAEPSLMFVAGSPVILPDGRVKAGAWPELALAMLTEPEPAALAASIDRLERFLKVDDADRAVIAARPERLAGSREARRRAMLEQSMRASQLRAPMRDPAWVEKIEKKEAELATARHAQANPEGKTDREKRRAAKQAKARVNSLLAELADLRIQEDAQNRLYGEARESILIARAHGDEVPAHEAVTAEVARDAFGARILEQKTDARGRTWSEPALVYGKGLRAKKLTGIDHAHDQGFLSASWRESERLHKIGVDYREAYESGKGLAGGEGGGGGGSTPAAPQPREIELSQKLSDFRAHLTERQRRVLDLVCGQDMRVGEASRAMAAHLDTTKEALRRGLARAYESRVAAIERRKQAGEAPAGAGVGAVTAILRRMRA